MPRFKFLSIEKILKLPQTAGVYCFKNGREILYVGKAANIRKRVKSHFAQPSRQDRSFFIDRVKKIGCIKTDSEIEALILEAKLIRERRPKYNISWRDDKKYFYVGVTREGFPRVFITHQTQDGKKPALYLGPFVDGKALKLTLKKLRKALPYRTCKNLPQKSCLWYQLGRCPAPCLSKSPAGEQIPGLKKRIKRDSQRNAKNIIKILRGKKKETLSELRKEMNKAADSQEFERAKKIRDQIGALENILAHAQVLREYPAIEWEKTEKKLKEILSTKRKISRIEAYDISNIRGKEATGSMVVFGEGRPDKNSYRRFKIRMAGKPNDTAMIKETLKRRFGHPEWEWPDAILIDGGKAQLSAVVEIKDRQPEIKNKVKSMALAKKKNELFIENKKGAVPLKDLPREIFNLILRLRDEAHRFAIAYHRKLRKKELLK